MTRGIRNNNPGNIDYNPVNDWQGQLLMRHLNGRCRTVCTAHI
ncbi:hypothetical protein [Xenorhabdus mauleonii]|nr:hypothetical protein [Xenorhabdus mauleonii]